MLNCPQLSVCGIIYCVMQGIFPARFDSDVCMTIVFPGSQLRRLTVAIESGKRNRDKSPNVVGKKKKGFNKSELYIIALHLAQLWRTAGERGLMT